MDHESQLHSFYMKHFGQFVYTYLRYISHNFIRIQYVFHLMSQYMFIRFHVYCIYVSFGFLFTFKFSWVSNVVRMKLKWTSYAIWWNACEIYIHSIKSERRKNCTWVAHTIRMKRIWFPYEEKIVKSNRESSPLISAWGFAAEKNNDNGKIH